MRPIKIGQQVEIDLFGLALSGAAVSATEASGIVVALAPGAITVRLDEGPTVAEVTVSLRRVGSLAWR